VTGNVAGRRGRNRADGIGATGRTGWPLASSATEVRSQRTLRRGRRRELVSLECPLLLGTVNLPQVIDTRIFLRGGTRAHEVRNRDGGQQSNDGHNDHDFHQREARFARLIDSHTALFAFLLSRRERRDRRVKTMTVLFTYCLSPIASAVRKRVASAARRVRVPRDNWEGWLIASCAGSRRPALHPAVALVAGPIAEPLPNPSAAARLAAVPCPAGRSTRHHRACLEPG